MSQVLLLPLDDRPCNYFFPQDLAKLGEFDLDLPPRQFLGNFRKPAQHQKMESWVLKGIEKAKYLILSLDTWLYGGLISSRKENLDVSLIVERLNSIHQWGTQSPALQISVFATLLRISDSNDATEEQPYWADYGRDIYRYSYLDHYLEDHTDHTLSTEFQSLFEKIPLVHLNHYKALRQRNFDVLKSVVDMLESGQITTLFIGCDDGADFGWNVKEKIALEAYIQEQSRKSDIFIFPGADELACTLLARTLAPEPLDVQVHWDSEASKTRVTRYEGVPLSVTLDYQARAAGIVCHETEHSNAPLLWLSTPSTVPQIDQFLQRESRYPERSHIPLIEALKNGSRRIFLADLAYANGGDLALLNALEHAEVILKLGGYSAWNTTGNSLGFILAWIKLAHRAKQPSSLLLERILDDGFYQGHYRQKMCAHYSDPVKIDHCLQGLALLNDKLAQWARKLGETQALEQFSFPWQRFFEAEIRV